MGNDDFAVIVGVIREGLGADLGFFTAQPIFGKIGEQNIVICRCQANVNLIAHFTQPSIRFTLGGKRFDEPFPTGQKNLGAHRPG